MTKDTIVVADDDRSVVILVSEFLRKKGFHVVPAFDAMQAMMGIRQATPKAVIMDVNMPGGTGLDVLQKLKAMTKTSQIPVLILTASLDPSRADEVRALGADEFLTKPVDLKQLHAALLQALGRPPEPAD
jgi:two-component system, response regulator, stage 0 sporulation protein F